MLIAALFDKPRFRRQLPNLVLLGITMLVVVIPMAGFYIKNPGEYIAPFTRVSIMGDWLVREIEKTGVPGWLIILKQLGSSFLGLVYLPLRFWYLPGVPLLRTPSATLFLMGLGALLLKPKNSRFHLLGLWILTICIPGGLSESVPVAQRYVAIGPALAFLVGYGLGLIAVQVGQLVKPLKNITHYLPILGIVVISIGDFQFYYFEYTPNSEFGGANSLVAQRLADTLDGKSPDWQHILDSISVFTVLPDRGSFYNSGRPMLPFLLAPLFYLGLLFLFILWRRPLGQSLLTWLLVVLTLGSVLINTAATLQRLLSFTLQLF